MTQLTHEDPPTDRPPLVDGNDAAATFLIVEDEIVVSFFAVLPELPIVIATGFSQL